MKYIIFLLILLVISVSGCTTTEQNTAGGWTDIELKNINSQENFKISDFAGKKVFFETFAVWCVNCKQQQDEIKKLREELDEEIILISLNSDPNEDEEEVLKYVTENRYNWRYAIATPQMSKQLLEEFGFQILNAPSAPIVMFCEDGSYTLLPEGHKTVEDLKEHLNLSC